MLDQEINHFEVRNTLVSAEKVESQQDLKESSLSENLPQIDPIVKQSEIENTKIINSEISKTEMVTPIEVKQEAISEEILKQFN